MIYSVWRPDRGGYDYYETTLRIGLGDDLPIPRLAATSPIGVASTDIGRAYSGGRSIGSGPLARGMITPLNRRGLSGLDTPIGAPHILIAVALAAGVGWWAGRRFR